MDASDQIVKMLPDLSAALRGSIQHRRMVARRPGMSLTPHQMAALVQLDRGPQTMGEFATGMQIGRAAATELIERLEEKGLATRERGRDDRRVIVVRISGEAAADAREVIGRRRRDVDRALAAVPNVDPGVLATFLRTLIAGLRTDEPPR